MHSLSARLPYEPLFVFTGKIEKVTIELKPTGLKQEIGSVDGSQIGWSLHAILGGFFDHG